MRKHQSKLVDYNRDFEDLANKLGDLTYDSLALFLNKLSLKISKDGVADSVRGRIKLASCLKEASVSLKSASESIDKAWRICKPYMDILDNE